MFHTLSVPKGYGKLALPGGPGVSSIVTTPAFVAAPVKANSEYFSRASFAAVQMGTGDFSLEAWVYPTLLTASTAFMIFSALGTAAGQVGYDAFVTGEAGDATAFVTLRLRTADTTTSAASAAAAIALNEWSHIAITADRDGNAVINVNGAASGVAADISARSATLDGAHSFGVGNRLNYTTGADSNLEFQGRIGPVRAYKGHLITAPQLATLYNGGTLLKWNGIGATLQTACAGAAWDMDEESDGSGAVTRVDDSGGGNDLTDNNTTPSAAYVAP